MQPPEFTAAQLESLCKILADTNEGLTGSEIGYILSEIKVTDIEPLGTKWKRLFNALADRQNKDHTGDRVLAFIRKALDPVRYPKRNNVFEDRRQKVNVVLAFYGLEYRQDGKFHRVASASTLSEAEQRANRLMASLQDRNVQPEILRFCRAELLQNNSFHAVLEATKSIASFVRKKTGLISDGAQLIDEAFGGQNPRLRINPFLTETEQSEQKGFVNLAKGLFGTFRNPTAHAPKIEWPLSEQDALDLFSLASYIHRRIDNAK